MIADRSEPARLEAVVARPAKRDVLVRALLAASAGAVAYVYLAEIPRRFPGAQGDDALLRAASYFALPLLLAVLAPAWFYAWTRSSSRRVRTVTRRGLALAGAPALLALLFATWMQCGFTRWVSDGRGSDVRVFGPPFTFDVDEWYPVALPLVPALLALAVLAPAARRRSA